MKNLLSLLERFNLHLTRNNLVKENIINIIKEKTHINLSPDSFNIKEGVLELTASPVVKNEIKLKEEAILKELKLSRILYK